jgi:hypothetical protein
MTDPEAVVDGAYDDSGMPRRRQNDPLQWRAPECKCDDRARGGCACDDDGSSVGGPVESDDWSRSGYPRTA